MSLFLYRALESNGRIAEGRIEAVGRHEACRVLEGRGLNPVAVSEEEPGKKGGLPQMERALFPFRRKGGKVSFAALEKFTRQLSSLLAAGVPLGRALRILSKEAAAPAARAKWREIYDLVVDGTSLADAMAQSPEIFPRVYVAMVHSGETGGFLDIVLKQIADFQMLEKELRSKLLSALIYPAVLAALSAGVLTFLMVFFIPRFQGIFEGFEAELPVLTQFIVAASAAARKYGLLVLIGLAAAVALTRKWLATEQGRRTKEKWILRTPVLGEITARFAMTRFCRMLGTLAGAGVPLINALRVAKESLGNQIRVAALGAPLDRVKQGDRLAQSLADCPKLFPGSVLEMITVAEETGRLDAELVRIATVAEGDLDRQLRTAVSLAEPALLFVMAGAVGTIVIGMVLPIFTIYEYIK